MDQKIDSTIINNAISAYLLVFISWFFLLNRENPNLNNTHVKSHTKTAILLHLLLFINYLVFISYSLFGNIGILGINLNIIIANIFFLIIFGLMIFGIYKAKNGLVFKLGETVKIINKNNSGKLLDINNDNKIDEKDKLTILLSYIPFVSYIIYPKYESNDVISKATTLNLFVSIIITLLYIFNYINLANLLGLVFIIFVVFVGVNLFSTGSIISINLPKLFSPSYKLIFQKSLINYIKKYFSGRFEEFEKILSENISEYLKDKKETKLEFSKEKEIKIPKILVYIPIINLFTLFLAKNKFSIHIRNGLVLSTLFIIIGILVILNIFNSSILLLFLFPILFGIGNILNGNIAYKMPYIYQIYSLLSTIFSFIGIGSKELNKKRKTTKEVSLKVEEK